ncbi:MAG: ABC transporter ATP-binding protein [Anaerolineae bacterium]|nr:ABC transporter ATP-binding protein [Anaerolineae bacterium]
MADRVVLRTEGLTKRFGPVVAVDGLSLAVHQGEVFGFLGPNGAGKTTSIKIICGLLKADSGGVFIHNQPLQNQSLRGADRVLARVGVCPQHIVLWNHLTCLEQLIFIGQMYGIPTRSARTRGAQLLDDMGLSEKRDALARTLSGGMQRRLNLVMALAHDPDLIVLDEPEAGLDPQSRVLVREYIRSLARHKTIILTTHNMDEAERLADRVAIIDHGRLLALDTPDALKRQAGEGDVLEITLAVAGTDTPDQQVAQAADVLRPIVPRFDSTGHTLILRAHTIVEHLPAILAALEAVGLRTSEVRLRATSLEDVFIALTGRRLRE